MAQTNKRSDLIIQAVQVTKTYCTGAIEVQALRRVDLSICSGEMVAITGPSGCGKSTLLNCLAGLDSIDSGKVLLNGQDLRLLTDRELTKSRATEIGFVFQEFNLLPQLSAIENVTLPLMFAGIKPAVAHERAREALEEVGMGDRMANYPDELSGGQQQRVAIARALAPQPSIWFADEPTGNLDSKTADDIIDLFVRLNQKRGQTLLIVTHSPQISVRMGRTIYMQDGQIISDGRVQSNT